VTRHCEDTDWADRDAAPHVALHFLPSFSITNTWHSRSCRSGEGQKNSTADEGDEKELGIICLTALSNYTHFPVTWLLMRNEAQQGGSAAPVPYSLLPVLLLGLQ